MFDADEPGLSSRGMVWVPTARGPYGELEDWKLVPRGAAADWDVRQWGRLP